VSPGPGVAAAAVDLRLVPPAVVAWGAALVVVHADPQATVAAARVAGALLATGVVALLAAAVGYVVRRPAGADPVRSPGARVARGPVVPERLRGAAPAFALGLATVAVVLVAGGATHAQRAPAPLVSAAGEGREVDVVGRVSAQPRLLGGADSRVSFTVAASAVGVRGGWYRVRTSVAVVAPTGAPVGATVRLRGTVTSTPGSRSLVILAVRQDPVVTVAPRGLDTWAGGVRAGARSVAARLPPDVRGLLPAVTVGDTGAVPDDLVAAMRAAGLAHVMAVSGAHFAILGALVLTATSAVRAPLPLRALAAAAAGAALLLVVGPAPSVVRAAVMGGVGLVGLLAGRRAAGPAALAGAVVVLLVVDPWLSVDIGFALSVAATAGLVVLGGPLVTRWSRFCGRDAAALLAAPVAAQLGCLPVTLALWPTLGPWSVVANVAVAPAIAPATVLGLVAAVLTGPWPAAADVVAGAAGAACWWIAAVARAVAGLPVAGLAWWPGVGGAVTAALVLIAAGALVLRPARAS